MASIDGVVLSAFNIDPVTSVRYVLALEKVENGYEIAKKVYDDYFVNNKNKETYEKYEEVKYSIRVYDIAALTLNMHQTFPAFFRFWIFQMRRRIRYFAKPI